MTRQSLLVEPEDLGRANQKDRCRRAEEFSGLPSKDKAIWKSGAIVVLLYVIVEVTVAGASDLGLAYVVRDVASHRKGQSSTTYLGKYVSRT